MTIDLKHKRQKVTAWAMLLFVASLALTFALLKIAQIYRVPIHIRDAVFHPFSAALLACLVGSIGFRVGLVYFGTKRAAFMGFAYGFFLAIAFRIALFLLVIWGAYAGFF